MKNEETENNNETQLNNENSDIVYTHVNDCDIESFQIDEKEEPTTTTTNNTNESIEKDSKKQFTDEASSAAAINKTNNEKQLRQERLARIEREKIYKLPQNAQLIVHPSKTAKNGKVNSYRCLICSTIAKYHYSLNISMKC